MANPRTLTWSLEPGPDIQHRARLLPNRRPGPGAPHQSTLLTNHDGLSRLPGGGS